MTMTTSPLPQTALECQQEQQRLLRMLESHRAVYNALGRAMDAREWPEGGRPVMTDWQRSALTAYQDSLQLLGSPERVQAHADLLERYGQLLAREWIPVQRSLPAEGVKVLVAICELNDLGTFRFIDVAYQIDGGWQGLSRSGERVTHWQSLPSLPGTQPPAAYSPQPDRQGALAIATDALRHIEGLSRRKAREASEIAAEGGGFTTTYDETLEAAEVLRRPSEIAAEALDAITALAAR